MCWGLGLSSLVDITEMRGSGYGHEVYVREEEVEQAPGFDAAKGWITCSCLALPYNNPPAIISAY